MKESEGGSNKEEAVLSEGECETSILEETEPLMAERNLVLGKNEQMKQKEKSAQLNGSREKLNRTDIELPGDIISQANASDGEREALMGEQEVSIVEITDDKRGISVSNHDITLQSKLASSPFGSSVNVTEGTTSFKPEEDNDQDLSAKDLLCFAWQVAQGMVSNERRESQEGIVQLKTHALPKMWNGGFVFIDLTLHRNYNFFRWLAAYYVEYLLFPVVTVCRGHGVWITCSHRLVKPCGIVVFCNQQLAEFFARVG